MHDSDGRDLVISSRSRVRWRSVAGQLVLDVVDGVARLVGGLLDTFLHVRCGLIGLAVTLQLVVVGEVASGLLDPALCFINVGVAHVERLSNRVLPKHRCSPESHGISRSWRATVRGFTRSSEGPRFGSKRSGTNAAHVALVRAPRNRSTIMGYGIGGILVLILVILAIIYLAKRV